MDSIKLQTLLEHFLSTTHFDNCHFRSIRQRILRNRCLGTVRDIGSCFLQLYCTEFDSTAPIHCSDTLQQDGDGEKRWIVNAAQYSLCVLPLDHMTSDDAVNTSHPRDALVLLMLKMFVHVFQFLYLKCFRRPEGCGKLATKS